MQINFRWYSHSGSNTIDNRDFCGIRSGRYYNSYIIADGSTSSPNGGELARELVSNLFNMEISNLKKDNIVHDIRHIHKNLRFKYASDSASFLLVILFHSGELITIHSGDCLVGKVLQTNYIDWLIFPHTLANAKSKRCYSELAKDPDRNCLTKSFRGRRFIEPEINNFEVSPSDQLLLASDGFWAELTIKTQSDLICGRKLKLKTLDDTSYLLLNNPKNELSNQETYSENLLIFKE